MSLAKFKNYDVKGICDICGVLTHVKTKIVSYHIDCTCHKHTHDEKFQSCIYCDNKVPKTTLIKVENITDFVRISTKDIPFTFKEVIDVTSEDVDIIQKAIDEPLPPNNALIDTQTKYGLNK